MTGALYFDAGNCWDTVYGETLGSIGSADFFSRIYTYQEAQAARGIPMGLAPGGKILKDITKGEMLTYDNFAPDTSTLAYKMRQMQDVLTENRGA